MKMSITLYNIIKREGAFGGLRKFNWSYANYLFNSQNEIRPDKRRIVGIILFGMNLK